MYSESARDEIRIEKLEVYAYHGVYPEEKKDGQTFVINATLYTDIHRAGMEDRLELSTDYGAVCAFIEKWMGECRFDLIEAVAEKLSRAILLKFPLISAMDLEIGKPEAPIEQPFGCVYVKVHRGWHRAYLSVGSNLGDRAGYIEGGVRALQAYPEIRIIRTSELIETKPYGGVEQGDFLNGALAAETLFTPEELLEALHAVEAAAGRERTLRWGPRTLDIDILFYDSLIFESDTLAIPHPDMANRGFVLRPLCALAPNLRHPVLNQTVAQMLKALEEREPGPLRQAVTIQRPV